MTFNDVTEVLEHRSGYVKVGDLKTKFLIFKKNMIALGLSIDGVRFDQGKPKDTQPDEILDEIIEQTKDEQTDIPLVWCMVDSSEFPKFVPCFGSDLETDLDEAIREFGIDIIEFKTKQTSKVKTMRLNIGEEQTIVTGNYRETQKYLIQKLKYKENRVTMLEKLKETLNTEDNVVESFLMTIPEQKLYVSYLLIGTP